MKSSVLNKASTLLLGLGLIASGCQKLSIPQSIPAAPRNQKNSPKPKTQTYTAPIVIGRLNAREITESSGLTSSKSPGIYWTHNDSGDGPFIYAVNIKGRLQGVWRVTGAKARDWEDISAGPGPQADRRYLYIGDIGDNERRLSEIVIYRVPEPSITAAGARSTRDKPEFTDMAEAIKLRYPDGAHDAEALLVHPVTGDLYVVTKLALANPVVYKASGPLSSDRPVRLERVAELTLTGILGGLITGGDISPDGYRVALCDYLQGYELILPVNEKFDEIWKQPAITIDLGRRSQGEAIAYRLDGRALLATSEGWPSPLIQVVRR